MEKGIWVLELSTERIQESCEVSRLAEEAVVDWGHNFAGSRELNEYRPLTSGKR